MVLLEARVMTGLAPGGTEATINTVLVHSPHVLNALLDVRLVGLFGEESRQEKESKYVLRLDLEER